MGTTIQKHPLFKDRRDAAFFLGRKLISYKGLHPLVLAVPRGGVPLGAVLADELNGELDVVLVHKLRAPAAPDYAIGAVSEAGTFYCAPYPQHLFIPQAYLREEMARQVKALEQRRRLYTPHRPPPDATHRVVLIVDDGIATGSTLLAAVREVDRQHPAKIVVASPVAPPEAVERLKEEADEMAILAVRPDFGMISDFYKDFEAVTDEEVIRLLKKDR